MRIQKELLYYSVVVSKYVAAFIFIIRVILNSDGLSILINYKGYRPGELKVNNFPNGPSVAGPGLTVRASGVVDGNSTGIILGNNGTIYVDSILNRYAQELEILLPVWYRKDGKLTIDRYKHEESFPFWRVARKVVVLLAVFNAPLIVLIILQRRLKKRYKIGD